MRTAFLAAIGLSVALFCACAQANSPDGAGESVTLTVEPDRAEPGDSVVLVLDNASAGALGYNLCTSQLERHDGGEWRAVPSDRVCTMELRVLMGGGEVRYPIELSPDLEPGEYRFTTRVEPQEPGAMVSVASQPFRVGG